MNRERREQLRASITTVRAALATVERLLEDAEPQHSYNVSQVTPDTIPFGELRELVKRCGGIMMSSRAAGYSDTSIRGYVQGKRHAPAPAIERLQQTAALFALTNEELRGLVARAGGVHKASRSLWVLADELRGYERCASGAPPRIIAALLKATGVRFHVEADRVRELEARARRRAALEAPQAAPEN